MRVKWWCVPGGLYVAAVIVGLLAAWTGSLAAEAEAEDYDADDCLSRGRACLERGEYEEALQWHERGLALEPEDVYLYVGKAEALFGLDRLGEALAYYDRALELRPDDWYMRSMKGTILWIQDQPEEAVESYDRAVELYDGGYPTVLRDNGFSEVRIKVLLFNFHVARAMALSKIGRIEEAVESFDRALALKPEDLFSRILVGGVPADPTWPAQAKAFLVFVHYKKAEALRELGRFEEAVDAYDRAIELEPDVGFPYLDKIEVLKKLGRLEEAVETCDEALALMPDGWATCNDKAVILIELGRLEEAVESLDRAITLYEDQYPSSREYGPYLIKIEILKKLGRFEDALETYDEALTRSPGNKYLRRGKGELLIELGRYEEAAPYFERPAE